MAIVYTVYKTSEASEIASEGFDIRNVSTDGLLTVVDKRSESNPTVTSAPSKPSYVVEAMGNWPNLTLVEAGQLIGYLATGDGLGDGWYYNTM